MRSRDDFHGGRSYAADGAEGSGLAGRLKSRLKRLFGREAATDTAAAATSRSGSPYSLLGGDGHEPSGGGRPVFPMADWSTRPPMLLRRRHRPAARPDQPHP